MPEPIIFNIFDFDSRLKRAAFDISECFDEKDKVHFGIRFNYPQGMSKTELILGFNSFNLLIFKLYKNLKLKKRSIMNSAVDWSMHSIMSFSMRLKSTALRQHVSFRPYSNRTSTTLLSTLDLPILPIRFVSILILFNKIN